MPITGRSVALLALLSTIYLICFHYEYHSLNSFAYFSIFVSDRSAAEAQLYAYFPHEIDCNRVLAGDKEYTKSIALHRPKLVNDTLDMSCESINARFSSAPAYNKPYSIAYAKIAYKDYQFLEQQMWNSYTTSNWYCFSIDSKAPTEFRSKLEQLASCLPNVLIANISRSVRPNGVNQNYAHLDCMRTLESKQFEYVFMLQNHDILTRTHREFAAILASLEGSTVVDKFPCPLNRCPKSYPTNLKTLGMCPKSFKGNNLSSCEAANIKYMKGGMQALLPKAASDFIVNEINSTVMIDMYTKKFAGDEQYFPSITTTEALKIPGRYSATCGYPKHLRFVIWFKVSKCGSRNMRHGVCVFGLEDLPTLKTVPQLLINKMLPSFDNGAIQCFNERLLQRSLGIVPSYDDISNFANGDLARFQRELRSPGFDPTKFQCNKDLAKISSMKPANITSKSAKGSKL